MLSTPTFDLERHKGLERAAVEGAVHFELHDWTVLRLSGPDRKAFLHSFCTNDINGMALNSACEAFITNARGRILGHVIVIDQAEQLLLLSVPEAAVVLVPHLQMYSLGRDVEILNVSAGSVVHCLTGPLAEEAVLKLATSVSRYDFLGQPTWLSVQSTQDGRRPPAPFATAGIPLGTPEVLQTLRVAAGFPWCGRDLTDENLAQEAARTSQCIHFRKGCYLGQEPIARLDAMGHTNRELRLLATPGLMTIAAGTSVLSGDTIVGQVTSSAISVLHQETLSLAVVRVKHGSPGTKLMVALEPPQPAVVRQFVHATP